MSDVWVLNASPIITLAKVGQLPLLEQLASEALVPEAVAAEILAGPATDPGRHALESMPPGCISTKRRFEQRSGVWVKSGEEG